MKFKGFTLAETLITLGIIGVVAAITIPGLITNHKKQVAATTLEKAISTLNQAIKLSESENGEMETWDKTLDYEDFIDKYINPYMKVMMTCNPITKCGYKSTAPWKYMNGTSGAYGGPNHRGRTPFIAIDGILYTFAFLNDGGAAEVDNDKVIIIDTNASKGPNQFGKDIFFLYRIEEEDSIIPYGADKTREEMKRSCSATGDGIYCAAWLREHGWKMPSDYPWK